MDRVGRLIVLVAGSVLGLGIVGWTVGLAVGGPAATGLGFLVLFTMAGTALPLLPVGAVLWLYGKPRRGRPHPGRSA